MSYVTCKLWTKEIFKHHEIKENKMLEAQHFQKNKL